MKNTDTTKTFRFEDSASRVGLKGRDGETVFEGEVAINELDLTEELVIALVQLAGNTLLHRSGPCRLPQEIDAKGFMATALEVASGRKIGRYSVSKGDLAKAATTIKAVETQDRKTPRYKAKWEAVNGPLELDRIASKCMQKRAEKAEAEKAEADAELNAMLDLGEESTSWE